MIDAKEAATKAMEYFTSLYPSPQFRPILLEEAELTDDKKFWLITLSYTPQQTNPFQAFGPAAREFKVFKLNSNSGEVVAMRIKTFK
jgi:hypothetical protein